ncbi:NKL protein, partial [Cepphus grylle]|nr:NKL protein [Cepphus grylle]
DISGPGRGKKCSLCIKILQQIKAMAGDDPDEVAVEKALGKACQVLGRRLGRACKRVVKKYREEISEALQNGDQPQDTCAAIGFCKA